MRLPPDPLKPFLWSSRVLVVCAPDGADRAWGEQERELAGDPEGQADRALLVLRVVGDRSAPGIDAVALRERLSMPPDRFEAVLVGKDGSIALRRNRPVELAELFARIDAMPMRREELRRRDDPTAS